ncbi:TIGR03792 family protein [Synechococcus sp. PCC 7336]|uniref:TIGR03792 family protein n=1 Tax=Synechococcus sp. PCC 7336 TaxID=195250 RepID=UPI00037A623C|nr:TIGR03792 family protein [Synechococcus sp. PCC 7336]
MLLARAVRPVVAAGVCALVLMGMVFIGGPVAIATEALTPTVVEVLEFRVPAEDRERFIELDDRVWTAALRQQPGFVHKSIWLPPENPEAVTFVIYWTNREAWHAFPAELQAELDRQMSPYNTLFVKGWDYTLRQPPPFGSSLAE